MNMTPMNKPLPLDKAVAQAKDFLKQYYADTTNHEVPEKSIQERQADVLADLREKKTYDLTTDELTWGARMAWRNAPRCPARVVWKSYMSLIVGTLITQMICSRQLWNTLTSVTMEGIFGQLSLCFDNACQGRRIQGFGMV